ncbi:hypothetical protein FIU87_16660 [Bacillus sp. THAF10]|nr:hypothetical protein FIU87_16660 [Bacillus sp. THAF10]
MGDWRKGEILTSVFYYVKLFVFVKQHVFNIAVVLFS